MVADSLTGPRQQVLFYYVADPDHPRVTPICSAATRPANALNTV